MLGRTPRLKKNATSKVFGITFEYILPNTPQQNGKVERKFATLYGRVKSMFNAAILDGDLRNGLWAE